MKYNFNLPILYIAIVLTTLSCGPRSGIKEDLNDKVGICGNTAMEAEDFGRVKDLRLTGNPYNGKKLFKQNCAVCHSMTDKKLTAPGLAGVYYRVPQPAEEWLIKFILNNEKVILSGDPYAYKVYKENGTGMIVYDSILSEKEVKDIIAYMVGASN